MLNKFLAVVILIFIIGMTSCSNPQEKSISLTQLRDKIAGGWAGKMIGVSYGDPTEFRYNSRMNPDEISWNPESLKDAIGQDDLYVQMTFMMTMDRYGLDAPAEQFGMDFANAGYMLYHANIMARKNIWDGILPPMSGNPKYNLHADDIDFQIEADFIGFMNPGMPQSANKLCDKIGHIMNYGDGVYGGMFVAALYTTAYFEKDIKKIVTAALKSLPPQSEYWQCVQDVIDGHLKYPDNWSKTWQIIQDKWGTSDICGGLDDFNIDAKINGAYIVMGLLYGNSDFEKTLEISTRCGQDSDCNPSNASGVLGIILGYDKIPVEWKQYLPEIADENFIHTDYSFNKVVDRSLEYAKQLIIKNGGRIEGETAFIKIQEPLPAPFEQSFPDLKASYRSTIEDKDNWSWKGKWSDVVHEQWGREENQRVADQQGSEVLFTFSGTGALLMGRWDQDCGKADVFVDDKFNREIDNYYWVSNQGAGFQWLNGAHLFSILDLPSGKHTIRVTINGKKNEKATGTKIKIARAIVYDHK